MVGKEIKLEVSSSPLVKVFDCKSCGASVSIRALGMSLIFVCPSCGTAVNSQDENLAIIEQFHQRLRFKIHIPLGTRGKIRGELWEVIGYMERSDTKSYYWSEYLLFNPKKGFRWLSENNGHWTWVLPIKNKPVEAPWSEGMQYGTKNYKLFHKGKARITYITGEFYWKARVDDVTHVEDYVSPPEILSLEETEYEKNWSVGEYIDVDTVARAFKVKDLPAPQGVAPNQPWDKNKTATGIGKLWVFILIFLFVVQMIAMVNSQNKKIVDMSLVHDPRNPAPLVTEPFVLDKKIANIELLLYSNLENEWVSASLELVNDDTGESQEYEIGAEYYQGYEDGESWSEGAKAVSQVIPSVPGGTYHLNITSQASRTSPTEFTLKLVRDVPVWSDFLWTLFWITLFPIFVFWRQRLFEMKRWQESDFSPYHGSDDDYEDDE